MYEITLTSERSHIGSGYQATYEEFVQQTASGSDKRR